MKNQTKVEKFEFEKVLETGFPLLDDFVESHIYKGKESLRERTYFQLQRCFTGMLIRHMPHAPLADMASGPEGLKEKLKDVQNVNNCRRKLIDLHKDLHQKCKNGENFIKTLLEDEGKAREAVGTFMADKDFRFKATQAYFEWMARSGYIDFTLECLKKGEDNLSPKNKAKYAMARRMVEHIPEYVIHMESDLAALGYAKAVHDILTSPKKNLYVVAKSFFDDFKDVSLKNLTFDHLPKDFCGTIRFPYFLTDREHNHNFNEVVFTVKNEYVLPSETIDKVILEGTVKPEDTEPVLQRNLMFAWYDHKPSTLGVSYFRLCEEFKGQTLEEAWIASSKNERERHPFEKALDEDFSYKKLLINMLVYIHTGRPDIRSFKNHIRYDSVTKKPKSPFVYLTEEDVSLVGYNWKKPPNYSANMWYSKPHLGWRWCGVGRTEMRLVWVRGALKSRKATDNSAEELIEDMAEETHE